LLQGPRVTLSSLLHCCTNSNPRSTNGTPHNCYSVQQSVYPTCCPVALTVSPKIMMVHRTIAIVTNISLPYLLPCCTNSKPHCTDGTAHNCYRFQRSVCLSCCTLALTISPTVLTVHRTIAIVTNSPSAITGPVALTVNPRLETVTAQLLQGSRISLPYLLPFCTNSKPHSADGKPNNCYIDQQSVWRTCCPVVLTVSPTIQTAQGTIAIETNSHSALPLALLH